MKKTAMIITLLALALTACSTGSASTGFQRNQSNQSGTPRALTLPMELAVGTFKLEGTKETVDSKMAAQLLPYWQLYRQVSASNSSAPEEITAVAEAIQKTMTPQQVQAITAMQLTQRDVFTLLREKGLATNFGGTRSTVTNGNSQNGNNNRASSSNNNGSNRGGGGGGFPGGGGGFGGPGFNAQQNNTTQRQLNSATTNRVNPAFTLLIDSLIKLLEAKIKS